MMPTLSFMFELRKFARLLFPGWRIPNNSVTLMETNPEFITAFMLGLNHEMGRELLWREYPTDQRGTYFRHFWGSGVDADESYQGDLPEIHNWALETPLNEILLRGQAEGQLVMIVRGDLLRRYPDTVIYAVEADPTEGLSAKESYPIFQASLGSDLTAVVFDMTKDVALGTDGGPGYLFVFQQQPTGPRFTRCDLRHESGCVQHLVRIGVATCHIGRRSPSRGGEFRCRF